jgi:hypothetical protein
MRPGLLQADTDVDVGALPDPDPDLVADLGLDRLLTAMARGDETIGQIAPRLLVAPLPTPEAIRYRQASVRDAIASPAVVRELYAVATDAIEAERRIWGATIRNAELVLERAANVLAGVVDAFRTLREIEATHASAFASPGFTGFFQMVATELDDDWLADVDDHLARLRTRTLHVSARLGDGARGTDYVLHQRPISMRGWRARLGFEERRSTITVSLRDQNAMNTMSELRAVAIAPTASVVRDANDHVLAFLRQLQVELAFLVGCVNLHEALTATGATVTLPELDDATPAGGPERPTFRASGLYDPGLRLTTERPVVANDVDTEGHRLVLITGANGGGKSTVLRAVGVAHLMLGAGMFVAARELTARPPARVLTHFTREEDAALAGGRLDEELDRLDTLVGACGPDTLVLLNESLSTTNEREGAAIARGIIDALVDAGVRIWFVTHNHQLARDLHGARPPVAHFLRAERGAGERPFRLEIAPPLPTSHGMDLYRRLIDGRR